MDINALPTPAPTGPSARGAPWAGRDPLAPLAAVALICTAVLWLVLLQWHVVAQTFLGKVPAAAPPIRLSIEAVGFDADVRALPLSEEQLESQTLVPPQTYSGYWLTPFGMPGEGSDTTTYIAGHSWDHIQLPFNKLSDPALVGQTLEVETLDGILEFQIDSVSFQEKDTLKDSEIWDPVPNRIVLISCYTRDAVDKNVVVVASPAAAGRVSAEALAQRGPTLSAAPRDAPGRG